MDKHYVCTKSSIKKVLDEIDSFIDKMEMFSLKYEHTYKYEINIKKGDNEKNWIVEIKIRDYEKRDD